MTLTPGDKTHGIPPMTDLQAILHASFELGKLAKAASEDGKIVSGHDLHMICALLDTAYAGLQEAILAERKACEPWMVHKDDCEAVEVFISYGPFPRGNPTPSWSHLMTGKDCTCGLVQRLERG